MTGDSADDGIPPLVMLFHLFREVELYRPRGRWVLWSEVPVMGRSTRETTSGGEFGWGGTSAHR